MTTDLTILDEIDEVVDRAIAAGNPIPALEYGGRLIHAARLRGYALAKLLHELKARWSLFENYVIGDPLSTLVEVHMGISPITFEKYTNMWEKVFANTLVDTEVKHVLLNRPIGDALLITAAAGDGSLAGDELMQAALTPDTMSLRETIREKRGKRTSSGTAVRKYLLMVDKGGLKAGTVYVMRGEEREVLGHFISPHTDFGMAALNSIINSASIIEVYR